MQHRNGDVGEERAEKLGDKHLRLIMKTPYPDDLAYGVVWGMARRFLPTGTHFTVKYDEAAATPRRRRRIHDSRHFVEIGEIDRPIAEVISPP